MLERVRPRKGREVPNLGVFTEFAKATPDNLAKVKVTLSRPRQEKSSSAARLKANTDIDSGGSGEQVLSWNYHRLLGLATLHKSS